MHWTNLASLRHSGIERPSVLGAHVPSNNHDHRLDALVLDLVEWLLIQPRPYGEVMEAWRTTCARLPIWEEAVDRGLIVSEMVSSGGVRVSVTPAGQSFLTTRRPPAG
jgi:hypothetical protein